MVLDRQIRKLFQLLSRGCSLCEAATRAGVTEKTARRYRRLGKLPSEIESVRGWRTREDPFDEVWPGVVELLKVNPRLQGTTVLQWLRREHSAEFDESHLRSLQRRMKQWRATEGPAKEVFFRQVHHPGDLCASDFTHMTSLNVTIAGHPFDHMVFHLVLTYSNWESVTVCFSESFESLSLGLQNGLWELGGVPLRHRTDRLSAAVNNPSERHEFTDRYQALMNHYGLAMEKTQPRSANENGDVESLHHGFKTAVDQTLMLRGSRDFATRESYERFLGEIAKGRNLGRRKRHREDLAGLRALPEYRFETYRRETPMVNSGSLIQVQRNTYSVHSRLIGEQVEARLHADHIEIWYAQKCVDRLPRLRGRGKHCVNYRHIIDWLVRKPGAFTNYRYVEELFPTVHFRLAYDSLRERRTTQAAVKDYLRILYLAAYENESRVAEVLRTLLRGDEEWTAETVHNAVLRGETPPPATEVRVDDVDLLLFDELLHDVTQFHDTEVRCEYHGCETSVDGTVADASPTCIS